MNELAKNIKLEINQFREIKKHLPKDLKIKAVSLLNTGKSIRSTAKKIGVHPSTLFKWERQFRQHLATPVNSQETLSAKVISFSICLFIVFIFCEYYLLTQSYLFHFFTLQDKNFAFIKAGITEIIPVALMTAGMIFKINNIERALILLCFTVSFFVSAYNSAAFSLNKYSDQIEQGHQYIREQKFLRKEMDRKSHLITFYQNRTQSNGMVGWPQTVKQLEVEYALLGNKMTDLNAKTISFGDLHLKETNKWLDFFLKILVQLTSSLIFSILIRNLTQKRK